MAINQTSRAAKKRQAAIQINLIERTERSLERRLGRELNRYFRASAQVISEGGGTEEVLLLNTEHRENVQTILSSLGTIQARFANDMLADIGVAKSLDYIESKDDESFITQGILQYFTSRIIPIAQEIVDTSFSAVTAILEVGAVEALPETVIASDIMTVAPKISKTRARAIARTETHSAAMQSQDRIALDFIPTGTKEWVTAGDARVRNIPAGDEFSHAAMDSVTVKLTDTFDVPIAGGSTESLAYPGDPLGSPGNVINCRCTLAYEDGL